MLKAMLVVTALGGGGDYTVEMPSMKECLDARISIAEQDSNVKTLCVPKSDDSAKVQEILNSFLEMIKKMRKEERFEGYICDSSVLPGIVIHTSPPRINCDEEPKNDWLKEEPKKKW
jgi:hypothetical protein